MNITREQAVQHVANFMSLEPDFLEIIKKYTLENTMIWKSSMRDITYRQPFAIFFNNVNFLLSKNDPRSTIIRKLIQRDLAILINKYDFYLQCLPQYIYPVQNSIYSMEVLPWGVTLGLKNGEIVVFDTKEGAVKSILEGHEEDIFSMNSLGNYLITGSKDKTIKIWDQQGLVNTLRGHSASINELIVIPQSNKIVSVDYFGIKIWNFERELFTINEPYVNLIDVFPGGNIITVSHDKVKVWSSKTGTLIGTVSSIPVPNSMVIISNIYVVFGFENGRVSLWKNGKEVQILMQLNKSISIIKKLSNNRIAIGITQSIIIYNLSTNTVEKELNFSTLLFPIDILEINDDILSNSRNSLLIFKSDGISNNFSAWHSKPINHIKLLLDGRIASTSMNELIIWN